MFKSTSGATSALNSEHVRDPADRSMVDDDSGYRQRHQVDSSRGALGHDSTNYFDSDRDRLEYTHRGGSLHGTNWGRNSEVGVEYADDIMLRSVDSQRSAATSVTWGTKATSDRPSPTEQLVAAILDGDVQGIRSIVHSKGDTLHSPYWLEVMKSILPLHRAISGLHFHGSDTRLISTLETLIQLGCNVKAVDHVGQTAVHKALQVDSVATKTALCSKIVFIQVCTSTSVKLVLDCLLSKGASASMRTSTGDAPIHTECRR